MRRTFRGYVEDILTSFEETQEFTRGLDFNAFAGDRKTVNAVVRSLEVMGRPRKESRWRFERDTLKSHGKG